MSRVRLTIAGLSPKHQAEGQKPKGTTLAALQIWQSLGLPVATLEHRFDTERRWRFDLAWPEHKIALEIEGGVWTGGRHTRGVGFLADCEKYNRAAVLGWRVVRVTPDNLLRSATAEMLRSLLQS